MDLAKKYSRVITADPGFVQEGRTGSLPWGSGAVSGVTKEGRSVLWLGSKPKLYLLSRAKAKQGFYKPHLTIPQENPPGFLHPVFFREQHHDQHVRGLLWSAAKTRPPTPQAWAGGSRKQKRQRQTGGSRDLEEAASTVGHMQYQFMQTAKTLSSISKTHKEKAVKRKK